MEEYGTLIASARVIDERMREDKKALDKIKAALMDEALFQMENKNVKVYSFGSSEGFCNASYRQKLTVENLKALSELTGGVSDLKVTQILEPKLEIKDAAFKRALIALYKGDYKDHDLNYLLGNLGLDSTAMKVILKKVKGDYWKDKELLESFGLSGELEEELDLIREQVNYDLVYRFFEKPEEINKEQLMRAIFVEETLGIGFDFAD